ncbi:ATP-dependent helicase [Dehalogenimonas etheniformans]|uniref:DNA 3'-5' helicase n=1 Tax=Dehalogenimonas etheniformans TaxID=1536648 RepID=A0A2P5P873_9CHLR|nr:UvrD-helicase domain-containing protein [Dehalogenimonas etheniformans]PPD58497.1 AAA family ATPase [Dehalogenimonas etheniformans]QNT76739.1 UvrD-helicase domain-containing protein [Dehalogenimonas etheniformans]
MNTDFLKDLNPAQRKAAEAIKGPVLILAGPGSGKTRVITYRIAYLVRTVGINPHRILAVTFTNKAAREMRERLEKLLFGSVKDMTLGTFHAICAGILRKDGEAIGIHPEFVIFDADDQEKLLKQASIDAKVDPKQFPAPKIAAAISQAKSQMVTPEKFKETGKNYFDEIVGRVYERYEKMLSQNNAVDFDDLLLKTVFLFKRKPEILKRYQDRYVHIMVDEFQDTNLVQYELVKLLAGGHRNIAVVGDPDQSIYSWRAADLRNVFNFEKDFPDAQIHYLEQNYRSTAKILETASNIIADNRTRKGIKLWTENEPGEPVCLIEAYNEQEEAQMVVRETERLTGSKKFRLNDIAVMYRTNAQSRALEEAFIRYGVPYKLVAGTRFYERREVKDLIAYFRLIHNPADSVSLMRIINMPPRGLGDKSILEMQSWAKQHDISLFEALEQSSTGVDKPPLAARALASFDIFYKLIRGFIAESKTLPILELFDHVLEKSGYSTYLKAQPDGEERLENIAELRTVAEPFNSLLPGDALSPFLESVSLVSDVDNLDETEGGVTLITLHQAKGLEFPAVFMVGLEEGVLPHFRSFDDPAQMEEERRLCYVGVTRAKRRLYLLRAFRRSLMGGSTVNEPSRFLASIPAHLTTATAAREEPVKPLIPLQKKLYDYAERPAQPTIPSAPIGGGIARTHVKATPPAFKTGDQVKHAVFGDGVVISTLPVKDDTEVVVAFKTAGLKKLLLSFARLEKT